MTYLREDKNDGPTGKILKIWKKLKDPSSEFSQFVDQEAVSLLVVFYLAAAQGIDHLRQALPALLELPANVLRIVHTLPANIRVIGGDDAPFLGLAAENRYFDTAADDEFGAVGGVTGLAISMADRDFLLADGSNSSDGAKSLRNVLASCIALNLLEPRLDAKNKGERWLILYLNRLLCLRFGLPLGYGGWRPRKIKPLMEWVGKASMVRASA